MPNPTHLECAKMSAQVYESNGGAVQGWQKIYFESDTNNQLGFQAAAYHKDDDDTVVIALRGTPSSDSKYTGEYLKLCQKGLISDNLIKAANNFIIKLISDYPHQNYYLTGHSMGGTLAVVGACEYRIPAIIFESPGFPDNQPHDPNWTLNNITEYVTRPNKFNTTERHIGTLYSMPLRLEDLSYETGGPITIVGALEELFCSRDNQEPYVPFFQSYTFQQHSIENMIAAFRNESYPRYRRKILSWPIWKEGTQITEYYRTDTPFLGQEIIYAEPDPKINPGYLPDYINYLKNFETASQQYSKLEIFIEMLIDHPDDDVGIISFMVLGIKIYEENKQYERSINLLKKSYQLIEKRNVPSECQEIWKKIKRGIKSLIEKNQQQEFKITSWKTILNPLINFFERLNFLENLSNPIEEKTDKNNNIKTLPEPLVDKDTISIDHFIEEINNGKAFDLFNQGGLNIFTILLQKNDYLSFLKIITECNTLLNKFKENALHDALELLAEPNISKLCFPERSFNCNNIFFVSAKYHAIECFRFILYNTYREDSDFCVDLSKEELDNILQKGVTVTLYHCIANPLSNSSPKNMIAFLLNEQANVFITDISGKSLLHNLMLYHYTDTETLELVLDHARKDVQNYSSWLSQRESSDGKTALHFALEKAADTKNFSSIKILLKEISIPDCIAMLKDKNEKIPESTLQQLYKIKIKLDNSPNFWKTPLKKTLEETKEEYQNQRKRSNPANEEDTLERPPKASKR